MQIVIEVPDEWETDTSIPTEDELADLIVNGTLLPKGHGRLIDADALKKKVWDVDCRVGYVQVVDAGDIDDAETIIEAYKEDNNANRD